MLGRKETEIRKLRWFGPISVALLASVAALDAASASESLRLYNYQNGETAFSTPAVELPGQLRTAQSPGLCEDYILPGDPGQPVVIDNNVVVPTVAPSDPLLQGVKQKFVQQLMFDATYLPRNGRSGVGFTDLDLTTTLAVPFPFSEDSAFMITPDGQVHFVDGPTGPDLPPKLYDANLQVALLGKLPDNFVYDVGIQPGFHSDGDNNANYGFRLPYYAVIGYRFTPRLMVGVGAAYLDRHDVHWVPLAGLMYLPDDNTRFELIPPRPRLAHRFQVGYGFERWWYFAAEFGGGEYAIRRASGENDLVDIEDFRAINGVEQISTNGGLGFRIEYGYVFGRHISYTSSTPSFDPPSTLLARAALVY